MQDKAGKESNVGGSAVPASAFALPRIPVSQLALRKQGRKHAMAREAVQVIVL
jgi:hypothetical protein